ncbi:nitroreductase [Bacillus gobiensis]|uniref:nitroreductase family protein n=1 Tax=Bacillus gobiensis TaxID=1441095 RepID=UPI003D1E62AE
MELYEAIKNRRSIGKVKQDEVPKALIEKILDAAVWAPNHFRTEPWRFFVLQGEGRLQLGDVLADIVKDTMDDPETEENKVRLDKNRKNPLRAPVVIAVGVEPSDNPKVIVQEEFAAVHAAVQNMLLSAHAEGLGAVWRTGDICYHKKVAEFFGLPDNGQVVGFIYLGYPDIDPKEPKKTSFESYTKWIG